MAIKWIGIPDSTIFMAPYEHINGYIGDNLIFNITGSQSVSAPIKLTGLGKEVNFVSVKDAQHYAWQLLRTLITNCVNTKVELTGLHCIDITRLT